MSQEEQPFNTKFLIKIGKLELSTRTQNCLRNEDIFYMGDLVQKTEEELMKVPNFGHSCLEEIKTVLASLNLKLAIKIPAWPQRSLHALQDDIKRQIGELRNIIRRLDDIHERIGQLDEKGDVA